MVEGSRRRGVHVRDARGGDCHVQSSVLLWEGHGDAGCCRPRAGLDLSWPSSSGHGQIWDGLLLVSAGEAEGWCWCRWSCDLDGVDEDAARRRERLAGCMEEGVGFASGRRTAGRGDGRRRTRARHRTGRCRRWMASSIRIWKRGFRIWVDGVTRGRRRQSRSRGRRRWSRRRLVRGNGDGWKQMGR
ncbi:hypothetical protein ACLOJK_014598 [Asimina triloba]